DATTGVTKREKVLCNSNGTDSNGDLTFPAVCGSTMSFPRFALSDGERLFIADGGNDRVLVYNTIPNESGSKADAVLGQITDSVVQTSDSSGNPDALRRGSSDSMRTPCGLAWDGENLYIGEPFSRRVLVYTAGASTTLPKVRNAASMEVYALGTMTLSGTIKEGDTITATIDDRDYKYKAKANDTLASSAVGLAAVINAGRGDPSVLATPLPVVGTGSQVRLTSKLPGELGNATTLAAASSNSSGLTLTAGTMSGGQDAAKIAPGTLISIFGNGFTTQAAESAPSLSTALPTQLAGVEVFVDGLKAPLLYAGPTQINTQLPWEVLDATSSSIYVRTTNPDGSVTISSAVGLPIIGANPGVFAAGGTDPRPGIVVHSSSYATASILITGSATANDVATVKIADSRTYSYTVAQDDTLDIIRDALIAKINADPDVQASAGTLFDRIRLRARKPGTAGNGIKFSATTSDSASVVLSANSATLCCANVAGAPVTKDNPAIPGETISIFATGLGMVNDPAKFRVHTGLPYPNDAPEINNPDESVSAMAGGKTANVLSAAMQRGSIAIYKVDLELNTSLTTDDQTQAHIAQDVYVSNVVTFAVKAP
ncbi:MAG TPA: hypothetical protein VHA11_08045, partial [Bryobacteraceae bacterium]|nr:hypothetical protein [Bryobacteraceae bacterium]